VSPKSLSIASTVGNGRGTFRLSVIVAVTPVGGATVGAIDVVLTCLKKFLSILRRDTLVSWCRGIKHLPSAPVKKKNEKSGQGFSIARPMQVARLPVRATARRTNLTFGNHRDLKYDARPSFETF